MAPATISALAALIVISIVLAVAFGRATMEVRYAVKEARRRVVTDIVREWAEGRPGFSTSVDDDVEPLHLRIQIRGPDGTREFYWRPGQNIWSALNQTILPELLPSRPQEGIEFLTRFVETWSKERGFGWTVVAGNGQAKVTLTREGRGEVFTHAWETSPSIKALIDLMSSADERLSTRTSPPREADFWDRL